MKTQPDPRRDNNIVLGIYRADTGRYILCEQLKFGTWPLAVFNSDAAAERFQGYLRNVAIPRKEAPDGN